MKRAGWTTLACAAALAFALGCDDSSTRPEPDGGTPPVDTSWAARAGGVGTDIGTGIAVGAGNDVIVAGAFDGQAGFGDTTLVSTGLSDAFVARYDVAGTLLWARRGGGAGTDVAVAVAADGEGGAAVAGSVGGQATFGNEMVNGDGLRDAFVASYGPDGDVVWARLAGTSPGFSQADGVAVDRSGNVVVIGRFFDTVTFEHGTLTSAGNADIFFVKYDAAGAELWVRRVGGPTGDFSSGIAVDGSGNVLVAGRFTGQAAFADSVITSAGNLDGFVAKYDPEGALIWVRRGGGIGGDWMTAIDVDGAGNPVATGRFELTADFGDETVSAAASPDVFVVKYDAGGDVVWARQGGGSLVDEGLGIAADGAGNIAITGRFTDSAYFGAKLVSSAGAVDAFVALYDAAGNVRWARDGGGTTTDFGEALAIDGTGAVLCTGAFESSATFGAFGLGSAGAADVFTWRIKAGGGSN